MNQSILFKDDLTFDQEQQAWTFTAMLSGELVKVYFHSMQLKQLEQLDQCTKFDLEEITVLWLEGNEPEQGEIHINMR